MRFPEFTEEWQECALSVIAEVKKGAGISKADLSSEGKPCILYGELYTKYKSEIIDEVKSRTNLSDSNLVNSKFGDIIIPSSGESALDIATARCVKFDNILLGGDLNIIRLKNNDGAFFSYLLNGVRKKSIAKVAQGSSVIHLYGENLKKLRVNYPSLIEQQKIASLLSLIDERIATQMKIIEELKLLKSAIAEATFNRNTSCTTIGEVSNVTMGQSPSSQNYNTTNEGLPLIQGNLDIRNGITKPRMWTSEITKECKTEDIIFTVRAPVGDLAKSNIRACIGRGVCSIRVYNALHKEYLYQYLLYYKKKWSEIEQGSTFASVSRNDIISVKIPIITNKSLHNVNILSLYDSKINIESSILSNYIKQKQHLLSQMFI